MGVELGKSGWGVDMMSSMLDIPGSTPVWAHCILILGFYTILQIIYIYIHGFQLIHCIKEHWWSLSLSWPDEVQRMIFDRPFVFKNEV